MQSRQQEVQRQLMGVAPKQAVLVEHLQRLVKMVVDTVSQQLKRKVTLSGDINSWLH